MECLKSGLDIFFKRSIQTSVVNSHTVTYKPIAQADNPAQLEFNSSGHSDYISSIGTAIGQHFSVWGHGGMVGCRGDVGGWAPKVGDGGKWV